MRVEHARLEQLACRLLDGGPIDWDREADSADSDNVRAVLGYLRVLQGIAEVHGTASAPDGAGPAAPVEQPAHWGHLRILEHVGRGSYGDVFRAWDETLDREVALKLLHHASGDLDEARRLARVRHPNFVTVYGAEVRAGRAGVWMEFLPGRTLARIVRDEGPFSASEAMLIGIDLCRSVAAVHAAGLLHRDIKAHNVIRQTGGRIVLMDLGAGLEQQPAVQPSGALSGTPLYMAPEVLGGGDASVASDIYSLGVLLFHLVTGKYPVRGQNVDELRRAHAEPRLLLRDLRPDLPQGFVSVVDRALDSDSGQRFSSMGAMEAALLQPESRPVRVAQWRPLHAAVLLTLLTGLGGAAWMSVRQTTVEARVSAVAVLPFQNLSGDEGQEYLADGLTEDLIRSLSRIGPLRVISRTSVMYYKAHPKPLTEIARELRVDAVLEGSIRRNGDRVRIHVGIVDGKSDRNL